MNIRQQVREVEKHIKAMANEKDEQIKIISTAQGVIAINKPGTVEENERALTVLIIAKKRIIHA